jgi:hypothetical protein
MKNILRKIKNSRLAVVVLILFSLVIGLSYGTFIFTTNSYRSTEMLVGNLTYGIEITSTGGSETINGTSVSLPSGKTSTVLLKITSLNKIISKYGVDYKMSSGTGSVKYASNTGWLPTGKINENNVGTYEKVIKVVISATTDVTVDFTVTGGYSNNDLTEVKEGYTRLTEVYDGIVDYKEDLKTIISKETTNNIYGGEAINNYLQYPTNTDTTKNIWRVLGYYNSVDGIKIVSNQTSTTTQSNISSSLTSFYNTLEKQEDYVLETNKFNCTNTTCTTSNYSNIGLLSTSEYNMLGGVNSYLASSESYFGLDNTTIKNITSSGITDTTTSTTSGLRPAIYLQNDVKVTGSGTSSDPYRLSDKGDVIFASATLNGTALETFPKESDPYIPKTVTCTNGSVGHWNTEKQKIELTTVNLPTSCVVDFTEGYTVTLNVANGTVTAPVSKIVGREGKAEFTITPYEGYVNKILTDSCNGTFSDNKYIIEDITSSKTCNLTLTSEEYTLALNVTNGTSDSTSVKVRNGEEAIFNLTPSTGYTTKEATITCDGSASGNISNNVLTFTSIDSNQTCSVNITKSEWNKYNLKTKLIYIWNKYNVVTSPSISYSTTSGTFVTNTVWSLSGTTPENSVSGSTFDRSSAWACSNVGTGWYTYGGDTVAYYITSCLAAQKKFSYSKTATISSGSSYSKGSTSYGTVTSTSSGTYPTNGKSGSYWYVSAGSTSQTLDEPGTLSGTIVADYGTYPENGKSENYWYIRK